MERNIQDVNSMEEMKKADKLRDYIYNYLGDTNFTEQQKKEITINTMIFMCNEILNKLIDK